VNVALVYGDRQIYMMQPKHCFLAFRMEDGRYGSLTNSESVDTAPSKHNHSIRCDFEIGSLNPQAIEIGKA
jgi:hypothetical protein